MSTALTRLVTRRSWFDRYGVGLLIWTAVATLCFVLFVVSLTLLIDILVVRGDAARDLVLQGIAADVLPTSVGTDAGLWVQVAHFRGLPLWSWLGPVCASIGVLGTTKGAISMLLLVTLLLGMGFSVARTRARVQSGRSARDVATSLRAAIHRQTLRLGPSDLTGQRYQTALKHFIEDTEALRSGLAEWRWRWVRACFFLPAVMLCILAIDLRLGLECLIPAVACWYVFRYERQQGATKRQMAEAHSETEVRFLAEALYQARLIRGYNMEDFERTLFSRHLDRMTVESSAGRRLERAALSTARFVTWAGVALILLLIALRVISGVHPLPLSSGIVLVLLLGWLAAELSSWERLFPLSTELEIDAEHVYRYLDEIPEVGQAVGARFIQPVSKSIILESVHYQQRGHEILRGIDLRIFAASEVGLVSLDPLLPRTVAYLLPRFIEPNRGRVLFDGEDIAWGTLESIRAETLFVGGDDPVLSGSVQENIICGDERYSLNDAIEAAKLVHAHKFISQLPQGYETQLGENGVQLSAGETFRIGLARALMRDPAVIIIDEPQEPLDDDTKHLLDDAYRRLAVKRTVIYLPSRLPTIRRCDQVIMLHDGQVEAIGTHSELTRASALYRHWDYITFNTFSRRSRRLQQV